MKKMKPSSPVPRAATAVKSTPLSTRKALPRKTQPPRVKKAAQAPETAPVSALEGLRHEVATLRTQMAKLMSPVATGTLEEVDALRRVLSDVMDARMNDVIRELVSIRNTAAAAGSEARRVAEQMDTLLADLGAMKFEGERLEHVDPLIHTVTREVFEAGLPDGVIVETIRPGFHTGRGIVVAKALVAVNRRP